MPLNAPADDVPDMVAAEAEGRICSICDGLGHGYPGGSSCPLEQADYSNEPWWAV